MASQPGGNQLHAGFLHHNPDAMITPLVLEDEWLAALDGLPPWKPPLIPAIILSPHPDDETLGAGGLIATLRSQGVEVTVVAVTDGENAYPESPGLAKIREREQTEALARLGVDAAHIHRLRLPDSGVTAHEQRLVEALTPLVSSSTHLIAPWTGDFHPDHEASGRAARTVAAQSGAQLTFYFFWTWHRGTPQLLEGLALAAFALSPAEQDAKSAALLCHHSQLHHGDDPILPENLLAPARRPLEVYLPA